VGGLPFGPVERDDLWAPFAGPGLVLPRWTVTRSARGAWLVRVLEATDTPDAVLAELDRLGAPREPAPLPSVVARIPSPRADWVRHVEAIRAEIRRGRFEKLVAARGTD